VTALSELLAKLAPGHPERNRAAAELHRHMREVLVAKHLSSWSLGAADRDDLVSQTFERILSEPHYFVGKDWGYVVRVLVNYVRSKRRHSRSFAGEDADLALARHAAPVAADPVEARDRWKLLDLAHAQALSQRRPQDKAGLEASWPQLKELIEGHSTMRELVMREEHLPPDVPERVYKAAQDKHYQAQKRCRKALTEGIEALAAEGTFSEDDLAVARRQLEGLLRVAPARDTMQRAGVRGSGGGGSSP